MKPLTVTNARKIAEALDVIADIDITDTIACYAEAVAIDITLRGGTAYELQDDDVKALGELLERTATRQERDLLEVCVGIRLANERGE